MTAASIRFSSAASTGRRTRSRASAAIAFSVLIENMRREGYEFCVGKPRVILKTVDGERCEPFERTAVEVPNRHAGKVIEYLGKRRGEMTHLEPIGEHTRIEFLCPSRGLIGARTALMTLTQGEAILSHVFECWKSDGGPIARRMNGALVADRAGNAVPYGMFGLSDRGTFFVEQRASRLDEERSAVAQPEHPVRHRVALRDPRPALRSSAARSVRRRARTRG